jgi:hypothetical protein
MAYAVVYRFEGYYPGDLRGLQKHHNREGGDLEHCDPSMKDLNEVVHGGPSWADDFLEEVKLYKKMNTDNEVAALNRRGRPKEAKRRREEGGKDPWKGSSELGVVRGILVTADDVFFRQKGCEHLAGADFRDPAVVAEFKQMAIGFLDSKLSRDDCLYMSFEVDEKAPHLHAYYRRWNEKETKTKGIRSAAPLPTGWMSV